MAIIQWVNLEKHEDYAKDPDIGSIDRCGNLTLKTAFSNAEPAINYKVSAKDCTVNAVTYSAEEKKRNGRFEMKYLSDLGNSTEVTLESVYQLPAAGGCSYKIVAKSANGVKVESAEIITKRKLYYEILFMDNLHKSFDTVNFSAIEKEYVKHGIVLTKYGQKSIKIPHELCISDSTQAAFEQNIIAKSAIKPPFKRIGASLVICDYLADYMSYTQISFYKVNAHSNKYFKRKDALLYVMANCQQSLWYSLNKDDDKNKHWCEKSAAVQFYPDGVDPNKIENTMHEISKNDIYIVTKPAKNGNYRYLAITIKPKSILERMLNMPSGQLKFTFYHRVISGFSGGYSSVANGSSYITLSTRAFLNKPAYEPSLATVSHELGHRMGMVPYGNRTDDEVENWAGFIKSRLPDAPPKLYGEKKEALNAKGHQGPHCESGINMKYENEVWTGEPSCTMFGSNQTSDGNSPPIGFCDACAKVAKKLDLSF